MGSQKTETSTQTRVEATPEERELNRLYLQQARAAQGGVLATQQAGLGLSEALLKGQTLPGNLGALSRGIDPAVTDRIVQQSLEDIRPGLQKAGVFNSGVRAELEAETAADIRTQSEQFNLSSLQNLLTSALTGQAAVQQPIATSSGQLSQNLQGLRSFNQTQTVAEPNPFLTSFQENLGKKLGSGSFSFPGFRKADG